MSFIRKVAEIIEREYPKERADTSWDNTGILLEFDGVQESLLICIDLTEEVVEEAEEKKISTILAYHPPIFVPLKRITKENKILHKCMNNRVSIYSPHTAFDGGVNGINHWLSTLVPGSTNIATIGYVQVCNNEKRIKDILEVLDGHLSLETVRYSLATGHTIDTVPRTMAVGAGASSRTLKKLVFDPEIDSAPAKYPLFNLIITGEASHHDLLYFKKLGVSAIVLEHSRSERGFLSKISEYLKNELPTAKIVLSAEDRDPIRFYSREK